MARIRQQCVGRYPTPVAKVPLIHVDFVRGNIGRWLDADVAVVGDARLAAERIAAACPSRQAAEKPFHSAEASALITAFHPEQDFQPANTHRTIDMRVLAMELETLPAGRSKSRRGRRQFPGRGPLPQRA